MSKYLKDFLFAMLLLNFIQCSHAAEDLPPPPDLRIGFFLKTFPDFTRTDLDVALLFWTEKFSQQVGVSVKAVTYETLEEMRTDFYQGKINFILTSPIHYITEIDQAQLVGGFKIVYQGSAEDEILVVTHKKSSIQHVQQMQNKRMSFLSNEPISALYANTLALSHFGKKTKGVAKKITHTSKSSQLIYRLFFQETDVIFVYKRAYQMAIELNPQIGRNTQVIASLPHIFRGLGFFHRRVNPVLREKVLFEAERMGSYTSGQQLLDLFYIDQLVRSSLTDIKSIEQLQQKYMQLIKQSNQHK